MPARTLRAPRSATLAPLRAPNRYCAARPPAPWHTGIAPNQHPARFIAATLSPSAVTDGVGNGEGGDGEESEEDDGGSKEDDGGIYGNGNGNDDIDDINGATNSSITYTINDTETAFDWDIDTS